MQIDWHSGRRRSVLALSFSNPEAGVGRCRRRELGLGGLDLKRQKLSGSRKTVPKTLSLSPWDHWGPQSWGDGLRWLCLLQECAVRAQRGLHGEVLEVGKASRWRGEWGDYSGDFRWVEGCTECSRKIPRNFRRRGNSWGLPWVEGRLPVIGGFVWGWRNELGVVGTKTSPSFL